MNKLDDIFKSFEAIKQVDEQGVERWSTDDLQSMLRYSKKQKFDKVIEKGMKACEVSGLNTEDHFTRAGKMIEIGNGGQREVSNYLVTREAAYLITQNGDSRKPEVGLSQLYFTNSTISHEQNIQALQDANRLINRIGYREDYKSLNNTAVESGVHPNNLGLFQDAGQKALQGGYSVSQLKERKGISAGDNYPDYMSNVELNANRLRMSLTQQHLIENNIHNQKQAIDAHARVGKSVRNLLAEYTSIMPEDMPAIESTCEVVDRIKSIEEK